MPAIPLIAVYGASTLAGGTLLTTIGMGSALVGGAIVGAVAGGIVAAVQGEDILRGALMGGVSGALMGSAIGNPATMGSPGGTATMASTGGTATGDAAALNMAEQSAGIAQAGNVAATGSTGAMEAAGDSLAGGVDAGSGVMDIAQANTLAETSNTLASTNAELAAQELKKNTLGEVTKDALKKTDTKSFWASLDSGEKMIAMTSIGGLAEGGFGYLGAKDAEDAANDRFNATQYRTSGTQAQPVFTGTSPFTSSQPAPSNNIASDQGLLAKKPTINHGAASYAV